VGKWFDVGHWLRVYQANDDGFSHEVCISAHGGYKDIFGYANIPDQAKVYLYELHGSSQNNDRSRAIMQGGSRKITGIISGGKVHNYHLWHFEEDSDQIPADVAEAKEQAAAQERLRAGLSGDKLASVSIVVRDIVSIKNRAGFLARWMLGMPLSYVFDEVSRVHAYQAYHLCFCRYVLGGWEHNPTGRTHVGA
jgi:hypothetical protein